MGGRARLGPSHGRRSLVSIAFVFLVLIACSLPAAEQSGPDIILGAPVSFTGNQSKEGALTRRGYDMWLDWVNGQGGVAVNGVRHRVQIKYEDDQSKPDLSARLAEKLISQEKVQFLLGPYGSSTTAAVAPIAEQHGIPTVEGNGAADAIFSKGYRHVFGVLSPAEKYLQGVLDMATTLNPKPTRIALLAADDSFSLEVAKGVLDFAPKHGMEVVFNRQYPEGSTNLYALLNEAKAKTPDILLNSGHLLEAVAITKAARDTRLDPKISAYSVGPSTPEFTGVLGKDADYVFSGSQWTPQARYRPSFYLDASQYVATYRKKFKSDEDPDYHVAESTAACLALHKAIENAGSLQPERVRDALAKLDMTIFYGRIKFDSRGANVFKPMVVEQIQRGRRQTVWPAELASAGPLYPTPTWTARGLPPLDEKRPAPKLPGSGKPPGAG
jgi:branched-chain amino acid transport system substrate-binding protein